MRSDLKKICEQKSTDLVGQTERALYLMDVISAITDRGNNAEVRRKNVSTKVVKIIQSYTGVVNKMVWRKF